MSTNGLWLPGMPRQQGNTRVERPFAQMGKVIRSMGFQASLSHDKSERVIRVRFTPTTDKTRQACVAAGGDGEGLEVSMQYDADDSPGVAAIACVERGVEVLREVLE